MDASTYTAIRVVSESMVLIVFASVMAFVVLRWKQSGADRGSEEKAVDSEVAQASTAEDGDDDDEGEEEGEGDFIRLDLDRLLTLFKWVLIACAICLCVGFATGVFVMRFLE